MSSPQVNAASQNGRQESGMRLDRLLESGFDDQSSRSDSGTTPESGTTSGSDLSVMIRCAHASLSQAHRL